MTVDSIQNGTVIDHIIAGGGMKLYHLLGLEKADVPVAIMMNVTSRRLGRKDIIKIDGELPLNFDVIGYVDPGATVNVIKNGVKNRWCSPLSLKMYFTVKIHAAFLPQSRNCRSFSS